MASGLLGQLQLQTIKTALKYMEKDPEKNLPKLVQWADKIDKIPIPDEAKKKAVNVMCPPIGEG